MSKNLEKSQNSNNFCWNFFLKKKQESKLPTDATYKKKSPLLKYIYTLCYMILTHYAISIIVKIHILKEFQILGYFKKKGKKYLQYAFLCMPFTIHISHYALHSMHFTLCTSQYAINTIHFTVYTSQYTLNTVHLTLST